MARLTPAEALKLVATSTFRPFTKNDWLGFSGCESEEPLICDSREDWLIIIDGRRLDFYGNAGTVESFDDENLFHLNRLP